MPDKFVTLTNLPLFPLRTVLFPGGFLPLKLFEMRYLDMARTCLREQAPFGVCLLKSGTEVAQPGEIAVPETVGCLAQIGQCDVEAFGMLLIHAYGTQRFRLLSYRVEPNDLLVGTVELIADDLPLAEQGQLERFGACAEVLERLIVALCERDPENVPFAEPFEFNNPSWVANRLAEILPLALRTKQKLLELPDAGTRIDLIHHYMQQHQLL